MPLNWRMASKVLKLVVTYHNILMLNNEASMIKSCNGDEYSQELYRYFVLASYSK